MQGIFQKVIKDIFPGQEVSLINYETPPLKSSHDIYLVDVGMPDEKRIVFKVFPDNVPGYKNPDLGKEVNVMRALQKSGILKVPDVLYHSGSIDNLFGRDFFVVDVSAVCGIQVLDENRFTIKEEFRVLP